jgi:DNA repair protein RadA/Sms
MSDMNIHVACPNIKRGTNIKDIKVPPRLRERYKTGIAWYDDALGGQGHVPSTVTMLTGMPGTGKSTLLRQLADAITGQGHICLCNTGEESLYQMKLSYERLKLPNGFITGQDVLCDDVIDHANVLMKANKGKQLFVLQDSMQTLNDGKYADGGMTSKTPVRCCEMLTSWAKQTYGIVIFINQSTKGGDYAGKGTVRHMIDAHANLHVDSDTKSETFGERLFEVSKNRWGICGKTYIVDMTERGLSEKGYFSRIA